VYAGTSEVGCGATWGGIRVLDGENEALSFSTLLMHVPIPAIICVYSAAPLGDLPEPERTELGVLGREQGSVGMV
jgi:hypothetical protein